MKPIIRVENLTHTYGENTPFCRSAVKDVSMEIYQGEFLGVNGHTGSGKSTLIQHLNGLLKPTGGRILLGDRDIWAEPKKIRDVRFRVGLVFQYPEYQLFEETAYKDIAFGAKNMGLEEGEISETASYTCTGGEKLEGVKDVIHCWKREGHGTTTFREGLCNSCNPWFMHIADLLGEERYCKYREAFGFTEKTGIDLPGESRSIYHPQDTILPVEMQVEAFGQNFSIKPNSAIWGYKC